MAKTRFHGQLEAKIHEEIGKQLEWVGSGTAYDFAAYKHATGLISGLKLALELADALAKEGE